MPVRQALPFGRSRLKTAEPVAPATVSPESAPPAITPLLPCAPTKKRSSWPAGGPLVSLIEAPNTANTRKTRTAPTAVVTSGAVGGSRVSPVVNSLRPRGSAGSTPRYRRMAAPPRALPSQVKAYASPSEPSATRYQTPSRASSSSATPLSMRVQPAGATMVRSRASATTAMSRSPALPGGVAISMRCCPPLLRFSAVFTSMNSGAGEPAPALNGGRTRSAAVTTPSASESPAAATRARSSTKCLCERNGQSHDAPCRAKAYI